MFEKMILPIPDQYGNYWFGKAGAGQSCILPVKSKKSEHLGQYYAGNGNGYITNGSGDFVYFITAELALEHLNELEEKMFKGTRVG